MTTAYPLLPNVLRAADDGRLSAGAVEDMLGVVETFLVRRAAVGVPTNQLRVIFRGLCRNDSSSTAIRDPLYAGNKHDLTRYLLERIEAAYGHKEQADAAAKNVQLEHVMPQTLTDAWRETIAPGDPALADKLHERWLHTLGNLTLTAYNGNGAPRGCGTVRVRHLTGNVVESVPRPSDA